MSLQPDKFYKTNTPEGNRAFLIAALETSLGVNQNLRDLRPNELFNGTVTGEGQGAHLPFKLRCIQRASNNIEFQLESTTWNYSLSHCTVETHSSMVIITSHEKEKNTPRGEQVGITRKGDIVFLVKGELQLSWLVQRDNQSHP